MAEAHFFHTGSRRSLPDFHQVGKRKAEESPAVFSGRICEPAWRGVI
jgi:cbb3-type cytochrome oxidase cytochrome c subunit